MNDLTITFFQQDIVWGDADANRQKAEERIAVSASGTDIFVVPETFTTGFGDHMASLAEPQEGPTLQWARTMAAQHNFLFVGTWIIREDDRCYNRLHWVYPDGSFGYYDKAHTFRVSGEYDIISRGTRRKVFEYKGWRIKPAVCYDLRFPKWLRNNNMQYELLLVCANWPGSRHEAWTTLLKARAIENLSFVLGCNRCGVDGVGGKYTGNSTLIDYKGFPMVEAESGADQIVTITLDKDKLDTFRQHWPLYLDFD
jgi:predicted amidohydrolase